MSPIRRALCLLPGFLCCAVVSQAEEPQSTDVEHILDRFGTGAKSLLPENK